MQPESVSQPVGMSGSLLQSRKGGNRGIEPTILKIQPSYEKASLFRRRLIRIAAEDLHHQASGSRMFLLAQGPPSTKQRRLRCHRRRASACNLNLRVGEFNPV